MLKSGIKKTIFGRWRIKLRSDLRKMFCIKKQNFNFSVNILVNSFLGFLLLMGLYGQEEFYVSSNWQNLSRCPLSMQ